MTAMAAMAAKAKFTQSIRYPLAHIARSLKKIIQAV